MEALHVQLPLVWQTRLHVFPSQVQVLEPVHVSVHCPVVDVQWPTQLSEPLHFRLQGPGSVALHSRSFGVLAPLHPEANAANMSRDVAQARAV